MRFCSCHSYLLISSNKSQMIAVLLNEDYKAYKLPSWHLEKTTRHNILIVLKSKEGQFQSHFKLMILQLVDIFITSSLGTVRLTATMALGFKLWEIHRKLKNIRKSKLKPLHNPFHISQVCLWCVGGIDELWQGGITSSNYTFYQQ